MTSFAAIWNLVTLLNKKDFDDAHDVFFAHHEQFFAFDLDGLTGILAEEHLVADLQIDGTDLAVFQHFAIADADDLALIGLLGGRVRNDDAGCSPALFLQPLDDEAVV